ncbi:MAG: NAD+ synthase [Proteobacteria bacterium]|nr:NAD+ synthase [Pseudomonadota bacterium]
MKIALAQINSTIGDFEGNLRKVYSSLEKAKERGADLCVFPEMALTGYPPQDLLKRSRFIGDNLEYIEQLARKTKDIGVVIGYVRPTPKAVGKRLQNAAALIAEGEIVSTHAKTLLPTYEVFDECRYFEPADSVRVADFKGVRFGITMCEDIWNTNSSWAEKLYDQDPVDELVQQGAEILINIAASPFTIENRKKRFEILTATAKRHSRPIICVNQVGGNDELIFDGHSLALDAYGEVQARAQEFAEDLILIDIDTGVGDIRDSCQNDEESVIGALALGTRDYVHKCGFRSVLLGLSGGIDSAIVAAIATKALGPENVYTYSMPSRYSSKASVDDAKALANNLKIHHEVLGIDTLFQAFLDTLEPLFGKLEPDATEENIQARVRAVLLMALSNKFECLLLATGNKSEAATGYSTLYGDMTGGLAMLADVPKTLVYRLADEINRDAEIIPKAIIDKAPSAELRPNQKDEDSLPKYEVLDPILDRLIETNFSAETIVSEGFNEKTVKEIARLVRISEHKRRQAPLGLKITSKSYEFGRRMPITQHWKG